MCTTTTPRRPYSNGRSTLFQNKDDDFKNKRIRTKKSLNKKSVRFDPEVTIQQIESSPSSSPYSTWFSLNEYAIIRQGVFMTLDLMDLQVDKLEFKPSASPHYCTRGLENYSTTRNGCLNPDVIIHRQNAIRSVMNEQELQRRAAASGIHFYNDIKMREACKSNATRLTAMKAVERGLFDSEIALSVYSEQQQQPHQQQQQQQQECNLFQTTEKKWIFTTMSSTRRENSSQQKIVTTTTDERHTRAHAHAHAHRIKTIREEGQKTNQ